MDDAPARGKDKASFVEIFENKYATHRDEMVYVGDDLFDCSIMSTIGYAFCPSDACLDIKKICGSKNVLKSPGGHNVVMELVEVLLDRNLIFDSSMKQIEDLDKKEKF